MSTQQIIESWENGVEPYNATKPLTQFARTVLRELKQYNADFIRKSNGWNYYGWTNHLCLYPSGLRVLIRRGLACENKRKRIIVLTPEGEKAMAHFPTS